MAGGSVSRPASVIPSRTLADSLSLTERNAADSTELDRREKTIDSLYCPEVSEAASAEEPEAAPVKPSAAAVSPKSRTRRRKKGDEEEKELFPFYEQSLF